MTVDESEFAMWLKSPMDDIEDFYLAQIGKDYLEGGSKYNPRNIKQDLPKGQELTGDNLDSVFQAQIGEQIDGELDVLMENKKREYKREKDLLYRYLIDDSNGFTSTKKDESKLILSADGDYTVQPHIGETVRDIQSKGLLFDDFKDAIRPLLKTTLRGTNIGKSLFEEQLRYAVTQLSGEKGMKAGDLTSSFEGDVQAVTRVLGRFINLVSSKPMSVSERKQVMQGERDASGFVYRPEDKTQARQHLRVMEDQTSSQLEPLTNQIREFIEEDEEADIKITRANISGEYLIGDLNLADLESRDEIYKYWEEVATKDFKNLQVKYNDLRKAFLKHKDILIGEGDNINEPLSKLIDEYLEFDAKFESAYDDGMNYVLPFKASPMQAAAKDSSDKVRTLFDTFLRDMNLVDTGSQTELDMETLRERLLEIGAVERDETRTTVTQRGQGEDETTSASARTEIGTDGKRPIEDAGAQYRSERQAEKARYLESIGETVREIDELIEAKEKFDFDALAEDVDPLFAYAFAKDGSAFKNTAILERELNKLKIGLETNIFGLDLDYDEKITDWIESLSKAATQGDTRQVYYLPLSATLEEIILGKGRESKGKALFRIIEAVSPRRLETNKKNISQFLELIASFVEKGDRRSGPSSSVRTKTSQQAITTDPMGIDSIFPARSNDESYLNDIQTVRREFDDLLDAVIDYYVIPIEGMYMPFDDDSSFISEQTSGGVFGALTKGMVDDGLFAVMAKEKEDGTFVDREDIIDFADVLKTMSEPSFGENAKNFKLMLTELQKDVMSRVYGQSPKSTLGEKMKEELGSYFFHMAKRNNVDDYENILLWNTPARVWKDRHKENPRKAAAPFISFVNHVRRNAGGSGKGSKSGTGSDKSRYLREKGRGSDDSELREALQVFNEIRERFNITKSIEEMRILAAHDGIRKMLGKPVYYGTSNLDDFGHIAKAQDTLVKSYNVDISAVEIENIVNEFDSMESLAKKYGVPSDSVYYLKANFR
tara:strand:- start:23765 stop:26770 length:3006 start_codon:yes stop_codon:yes gene_type:complete